MSFVWINPRYLRADWDNKRLRGIGENKIYFQSVRFRTMFISPSHCGFQMFVYLTHVVSQEVLSVPGINVIKKCLRVFTPLYHTCILFFHLLLGCVSWKLIKTSSHNIFVMKYWAHWIRLHLPVSLFDIFHINHWGFDNLVSMNYSPITRGRGNSLAEGGTNN